MDSTGLKRALSAATLLVALGMAGPAMADCNGSGGVFDYLSQGQTFYMQAVTTSGSCAHGFNVNTDLTIESFSAASGPKNGRLVQVGPATVGYIANKGFKGQDGYVLRVCGRDRAGRGCSLLDVKMTVQ